MTFIDLIVIVAGMVFVSGLFFILMEIFQSFWEAAEESDWEDERDG